MGSTGDHSFGTIRKGRPVKIIIPKEGDIWFEAWLARRRSLHKDLGGVKPQVEAVASVKIFR